MKHSIAARLLRRAAACLALAALATHAMAQADRKTAFTEAYRHYEEGRCAAALRALEPLGTARASPRVESLRGLCLYAEGQMVEARIAFTRYMRLVPASQQGTTAHQSIVEVIAQVDAAIQAADKTFAADRQNQRMQEAQALANRTKGRIEEQQQRVVATSGQSMLAAHARSPDKAAFDAALRSGLEGKELQATQSVIAGAAAKTTTKARGSLGEVLGSLTGERRAFHVFPNDATSGMASYRLDEVKLSGNTVDYSSTGVDRTGRELKESGTIQGLDLARVVRYTTSSHGDMTVHLFEFDKPMIWRRGGARWADGRSFPNDLASVRGERELRIQAPAAQEDSLKQIFGTLIDAAKASDMVR